MVRIRQKFDAAELADVRLAVLEQLLSPQIASRVKCGERVAVCVGSRGIYKIDKIVAASIEALLELGASPFLVPAMGSHGGATAAGQRKVLASYGISEETMGVPLDDSMEAIFLGETGNNIPVWFSKAAYEADHVLPINRVKAHTDFSGPIESGLVKMLTIGLGKEKGCNTLHRCGTGRFAEILPEAGRKVLATGKMRFGLAVVENGYDHTAMVRAVRSEDLMQTEPALLKEAKRMMPGIPFPHIDVLIVEHFGKDISGAGMDPNVTGRSSAGKVEGFCGPEIQQIVVSHLTELSHGNAVAINVADFITRDFYELIDFNATYKNALACCNPASAKIPVVAETEEEAVALAVSCCRGIGPAAPRIVRIRSTSALDELLISESLLEEAHKLPTVEFLG